MSIIGLILNQEKYFRKLLVFFKKFSTVKLIFGTILLDLIITLIFSYLLFPSSSNGAKFENVFDAILLAVILAPLIETAFFQYFIFKIFSNFKYKLYLIPTLLSAFLFGISHFYSIPYMMKTFISGFLFAMLYITSIKKKKNPFIVVAVTHSVFNAIAVLINFITNDL